MEWKPRARASNSGRGRGEGNGKDSCPEYKVIKLGMGSSG